MSNAQANRPSQPHDEFVTNSRGQKVRNAAYKGKKKGLFSRMFGKKDKIEETSSASGVMAEASHTTTDREAEQETEQQPVVNLKKGERINDDGDVILEYLPGNVWVPGGLKKNDDGSYYGDDGLDRVSINSGSTILTARNRHTLRHPIFTVPGTRCSTTRTASCTALMTNRHLLPVSTIRRSPGITPLSRSGTITVNSIAITVPLLSNLRG